MEKYYIYELVDPRNDLPFYVGKGCRNRAWTHLKETSDTQNVHKSRVINKIRLAGFEPYVKIVQDNLSEEEAFSAEMLLISYYGRTNDGGILTNQTLGGTGCSGYQFTEAQRAKMAEAKIGTKQSQDTKEKRSKSLTGIKRSAETREKMRLAKLGSNNPSYGKSSPRKGKAADYSPSTIAKIKEARAEQTFSDETRKKMSETHKLRHAKNPVSYETRRKISEARKAAWQLKKQ